MHPSIHALAGASKPAVIMAESGVAVSYRELADNSNRVAQLIRARGLQAGSCIALLMENVPQFFEIVWGAQRSGMYYAAVSTKLTAGEIEYILRDSGAAILFASATLGAAAAEACARIPNLVRFAVGGAITGFEEYTAARDAHPPVPIPDESAGADMLYSSGTTGRPKGIRIPLKGEPIDADTPMRKRTRTLYGFAADSVYLSPAPLYHGAPLRWTMGIHRNGGTVVVLERFEAESFLAMIERHRVTITQVVPTMLVRLLRLPREVRSRYDISSLRCLIHAAAPCSVPIKREIIDWFGPIVHEYYAASEGNGLCAISSKDWLSHPGSVGQAVVGRLLICDEEGAPLPPGREGMVYFVDGPSFEYHGDPAKTVESRHPTIPNCSTLGDIGYIDEEGYLYLTDRKAFMIISGGVNIYPQEIENLLINHPRVSDVAVFGVPNADFGEEVKAVIQPTNWADAGPELAAELMAMCRAALSPIKCPRSIDFERELPRQATGKLFKRELRKRYWPASGATTQV